MPSAFEKRFIQVLGTLEEKCCNMLFLLASLGRLFNKELLLKSWGRNII